MSPYLSQKISVLSMISIIGVLIIHSYYHEAASFYIASFLQDLIGGQVVRSCIPLFFLISGYLFFVNISAGSFRGILEKLRKRARSLLVPYFIWNTLFFLSIVGLQLIPWIAKFVNTDFLSILKRDTGSIITYLYWEPAAFHLWFLQYLILFMLSTPLLLLILSKKYSAWIFALCVYAVLGVFCLLDSYAQNYLFFIAGAYIGFFKIDVSKRMSLSFLIIASFIYVCWGIINTVTPAWTIPQCEPLRLALGCLVIWGIYDYFYEAFPDLCKRLLLLSGFTFFVYLFHEPWINIYKKLSLRIFGVNEISLIVSYILVPFIMYATCIVIAKCIHKFLPKTYSILTGGRI